MNTIRALATIKSASGTVATDKDGAPFAIINLVTEEGQLDLSLVEWGDIYASMVKCWPTIKPLKEKVAEMRWKKHRKDIEDRKKAKEKAEAAAKRKSKAKADKKAKADTEQLRKAAEAADKKGILPK